jgi:hypothetical protein
MNAIDKHRKCTAHFVEALIHRTKPVLPSQERKYLSLLLGDTDGSAAATSGLGVLSTDTETPVVTETTVSADLLEALEILTELGVDTVGEDLSVLAVDNVTLPVEEPGGDLVCLVLDGEICRDQVAKHTLQGVLDDGDNTLKLLRCEVTGALAQINIGLLADQVGVAATDTLDLGQGVHDLLLSIDVRVQQTDDVLEAVASQHCCSRHTHYSQGVQSSCSSCACAQRVRHAVASTSPVSRQHASSCSSIMLIVHDGLHYIHLFV